MVFQHSLWRRERVAWEVQTAKLWRTLSYILFTTNAVWIFNKILFDLTLWRWRWKKKKSRLVQGLCLISAPIFISLWSVLVNNYVTVEWRDITVETSWIFVQLIFGANWKFKYSVILLSQNLMKTN